MAKIWEFFKFEDEIIPLEDWIDSFSEFIQTDLSSVFKTAAYPLEVFLDLVDSLFLVVPSFVIMAVFTFIAFRRSGVALAVFTFVSLLFIGMLGLWEETMSTLALVACSVFVCILIGIPLGILAARHKNFNYVLRPILDIMQTTPAFVYLIPVVILFNSGKLAGLIATIIFALPPIIRLTTLGINQVDKEVVEAAKAFGSTKNQMLFKVQLPLAKPGIFIGINQTIMMSLSMVVIASLIGAGGVGDNVNVGLRSLNMGMATVAGIAIVLIAMILDRITQTFSK